MRRRLGLMTEQFVVTQTAAQGDSRAGKKLMKQLKEESE